MAFDVNDSASIKSILEPSCGRGALIDEALIFAPNAAKFVGVDIDAENIAFCRERYDHQVSLHQGDFLECVFARDDFDVALMNPPFESGQTERHILHALKWAHRVVCHCPLTTLAGQERREGLWKLVDLRTLAICSTRPKYGEKAGMTDMCTIDVTLRPGWATCCERTKIVWWP
jgi:SAM-dependent methyltransferase